MNIVKKSDLSFYNEQGILTLNAKQFDTGRMFIFNIMDSDEPFDLSNCSVYLRIQKADGTQFQGNECCLIDGSKIIINPAAGNGNQILAAAGNNKCELHLEDNNGISLTTWTFNIYVEKRVHNAENLSSYDSYDVIDNMVIMERDRIESEKIRKRNEDERKINENQRIDNEENRQSEFNKITNDTNAIISECNLIIKAIKEKVENFDNEINEIVDGITNEAKTYADNAKESEIEAANAADNSKYYSEQSHNSATMAQKYFEKTENTGNNAIDMINGAIDNINKGVPKFKINFEDGILYHTPSRFTFVINQVTGQLEWGVTI